MNNPNVPIKIFASPRARRSDDHRDETRVVDLIGREVLPKAKKAAYHSVSVKNPPRGGRGAKKPDRLPTEARHLYGGGEEN